MLGINSDGTPMCSSGPVQSRLAVTACPPGQILQNLRNASSGCVADAHFVGSCGQNTSLTGVSPSGQPQCGNVVTPAILAESNEAVVRSAELLVNSTNPDQTAALLRCASQGLTYNSIASQCEPTFDHIGCPTTVPNRTAVGPSAVCPPSSRDFQGRCLTYCPYGTTNSTMRTANVTCGALAQWGTSGVTCSPVACPANSSMVNGRCTCDRGFYGSISWSFANGTYSGTCRARPCSGTLNYPNCSCPTRYQAGMQTWLPATQRWSLSSCTPVACPSGASGAPNCACTSAYFGTVTHNTITNTWSGQCTRKITTTRCASSGSEGRWATVSCPSGLTIRRFIWACYGRSARCSNTDCRCGRTLTTHSRMRACIGRSSCRNLASNSWWGDPCGGWNKPLVMRVECTNWR